MGQREKNLKATVKMIETVLTELGLAPKDNRLATKGYAWGIAKGSAEVFIFVNPGSGDDPGNHLRCVSPVMVFPEAPTNQLALFRRLLELNAEELSGAAFGLKGDTLVITTERSTVDLDASEVQAMILLVGYYADHYDDLLVTEFGGKRHADTAQHR